jgi:hypothetical protein
MKIVLYQRERAYYIDRAIVLLENDQQDSDFLPPGFTERSAWFVDVDRQFFLDFGEMPRPELPMGIVFHAEPEKK